MTAKRTVRRVLLGIGCGSGAEFIAVNGRGNCQGPAHGSRAC